MTLLKNLWKFPQKANNIGIFILKILRYLQINLFSTRNRKEAFTVDKSLMSGEHNFLCTIQIQVHCISNMDVFEQCIRHIGLFSVFILQQVFVTQENIENKAKGKTIFSPKYSSNNCLKLGNTIELFNLIFISFIIRLEQISIFPRGFNVIQSYSRV